MASSLVLLVDDDTELTNMLVDLLAREGIQAHAALSGAFRRLPASTGEAGRRAMRSLMPDVLLRNMMLPDANSLDLCREWRSADHGLGILVLSAPGRSDGPGVGLC